MRQENPISERARTRIQPFVVVVWHVKVVGYIRVSTEDQADSGAGLEAQRAAIHEQCRRRSWELLAIHSDTASARSLAARPGLMRALADVEGGAAGTLVVAKLDRLSRSLMDFS